MNSSLVGGLVALAGMQASLFSFMTHGEQKSMVTPIFATQIFD